MYVAEVAEARRRAEERGVRRERNMRARTQVRLPVTHVETNPS